MKKFTKGFTLIELLIVIALLGALAVGLLAALDPFEQLKKGTDTGVRNTAAELHGAIVRYYAIKNIMPWCTAVGACAVDGFNEGSPNLAVNLKTTVIPNIVGTGELKSAFSSLAGDGTLGKLVVFGNNTTATVEVCYKPLAKSFIEDPNTKFVAATGVEAAAGTCKGQGGADLTCLWCIN
ncbi:MAG: prepilin-type N-terminal cleavage/methylation domain-containing protein [Patescibacteria group bacterium]|jgi:prepilin-type N-terminal cleavage/methylation domain-containing protein